MGVCRLCRMRCAACAAIFSNLGIVSIRPGGFPPGEFLCVLIIALIPHPPDGLPELLVATHTSRQSCCNAGKARISRQFGLIRGIPANLNLP